MDLFSFKTPDIIQLLEVERFFYSLFRQKSMDLACGIVLPAFSS